MTSPQYLFQAVAENPTRTPMATEKVHSDAVDSAEDQEPMGPEDAESEWQIRSIRRSDAPAIRRLWTRLGDVKAEDESWIQSAIDPTTPRIDAVVAVAPEAPLSRTAGAVDDPFGVPIVGFQVYGLASPGYAIEHVDGHVAPGRLGDQPGVLRALAVHPDWEGQGVGTALVERAVDELADSGAEAVVSVNWVREGPDSGDSTGLFDALGFEEVARDPDFYARIGRDDCPDCEGLCACPAAIFCKRLD